MLNTYSKINNKQWDLKLNKFNTFECNLNICDVRNKINLLFLIKTI